jgi:hypothetical protein
MLTSHPSAGPNGPSPGTVDPIAFHDGRDERIRGLDHERRAVHQPPGYGEVGGAPGAVAARAVRRAVGVEKANADTTRAHRPHEHESVHPHSRASVAHVPGDRGALFIGPLRNGNDEIVSGPGILAELHLSSRSLQRVPTHDRHTQTDFRRPIQKRPRTRLGVHGPLFDLTRRGATAAPLVRHARSEEARGVFAPSAAHAEATARPCRARLGSTGHWITSLRRVGHRAPHRCPHRSSGKG